MQKQLLEPNNPNWRELYREQKEAITEYLKERKLVDPITFNQIKEIFNIDEDLESNNTLLYTIRDLVGSLIGEELLGIKELSVLCDDNGSEHLYLLGTTIFQYTHDSWGGDSGVKELTFEPSRSFVLKEKK